MVLDSKVRSTMVPPTSLARELVDREPGGLEELRVQEFPDDESAHDDALHARLHAEFSAEFDRVQAELARTYGEPLRTGAGDDDLIPFMASSASHSGRSATWFYSLPPRTRIGTVPCC